MCCSIQFLTIASQHHIRPLFVFFDDCWNADPKIGKQPEPRKSVHNSGWMQSPGAASVNDPSTWDRLQKYETDILTTFGQDNRVLMWDLYNEPGNGMGESRWKRYTEEREPAVCPPLTGAP